MRMDLKGEQMKRLLLILALSFVAVSQADDLIIPDVLVGVKPQPGVYIGGIGSMINSSEFEPTIGAGVIVGYDTGYLGNLELGARMEARMTIQNYSNTAEYSSISGWYVDTTVTRFDAIVKPYSGIFYLLGGVSAVELPIIEGEDHTGYYQTTYESMSLIFGAGLQSNNFFGDVTYRNITSEVGLNVGYVYKF